MFPTSPLSKPASSLGMPVKCGGRRYSKMAVIFTAPVRRRCLRFQSRSTVSTATCAKKAKLQNSALGYGGSVGALKAMGAIEMGLTEDELPPLVDAWRQTNPNIVKFWWDVDRAVMEAVKHKHTTSSYGLTFSCRSGILFITLPSGRTLPMLSRMSALTNSAASILPMKASEPQRNGSGLIHTARNLWKTSYRRPPVTFSAMP